MLQLYARRPEADLVNRLAQIYLSQSDPDGAIALLQRLIHERNDVSAYRWTDIFQTLARAFWAKGQKAEAIQAVEEGLRRFPAGWQADRLRKVLEEYRQAAQ